MKRVYLNREECRIEKGKVFIKGDTYHYLKNVLRATTGFNFLGFDGSGREYLLRIEEIKRDFIEATIMNIEKKFDVEVPFDVVLFQSLPKRKKMESIIESTTQLGVKKIFPVISKRVVVDLKDEKKEKKLDRWRKISSEASKISGRSFIPTIGDFLSFKSAIKMGKDIGIIFWEGESRSLREIINENIKESVENKKVHIFVGPEGGYDEEEIQLAKENGFLVASLGKRILKVEIASCVATALVIYELENR